MPDYSATLLLAAVQLAVTAGVSYGAVKASLNGTREDVRNIRNDVKQLIDLKSQHGERIARLEAAHEQRD